MNEVVATSDSSKVHATRLFLSRLADENGDDPALTDSVASGSPCVPLVPDFPAAVFSMHSQFSTSGVGLLTGWTMTSTGMVRVSQIFKKQLLGLEPISSGVRRLASTVFSSLLRCGFYRSDRENRNSCHIRNLPSLSLFNLDLMVDTLNSLKCFRLASLLRHIT